MEEAARSRSARRAERGGVARTVYRSGNIYRLSGGLLVEHWDEWDLAGLLQKLS